MEKNEIQASSVKIFDTPTARTALGSGYLLAGRLDEADAFASRAAELAVERGFRGSQARALHLVGDIGERRDPPELTRSEDHYRRALALADELGMAPLVAHCHFGLARLGRLGGDPREAEVRFETALAMYRDLDMGFWLAQATAAIEAHGSTRTA